MKRKIFTLVLAVSLVLGMMAMPTGAETLWETGGECADIPNGSAQYVEGSTLPEGMQVEGTVVKVKPGDQGAINFAMVPSYTDTNGATTSYPAGLYRFRIKALMEDTPAKMYLYLNAGAGIYPSDSEGRPMLINANSFALDFPIANQWVTFEEVFEIKEGAFTQDYLTFYVGNSWQYYNVYLDDWALEKITPEVEYFKAGSFARSANTDDSSKYAADAAIVSALYGEPIETLPAEGGKIKAFFAAPASMIGTDVSSINVMHAVYKIEGGVKKLHSVDVNNVTKNSRNMFTLDKEIDVPASTDLVKYVVKSFVFKSVGSLATITETVPLSLPVAAE